MSGCTYVEYGVIVDRTSKGLGYFLAETYRDYDPAKKHAMASGIRYGFPAEVKQRVVTMTDWAPTERTRTTPPGMGVTP